MVCLGIILVSCNRNTKSENMNSLSQQVDVVKSKLEEIKEFTPGNMLFGHKSVGSNIMNGVGSLAGNMPGLGIVVTSQDSLLSSESKVFYHYNNGENKLPFGKIDSFYAALNRNHKNVSIAFVKFCYADIIYSTDVRKLFLYYQEQMARIGIDFPGIRLIHFTVPLNTRPKGIKGVVRSVIRWDSNRTREEFNNLIRKNYPEDRVFDLAKYESAYPDDKFEKSSTGIRALRPDLTSDGGHLNITGAEYIGALLLLKIQEVATD